jgi:hypothetical protein
MTQIMFGNYHPDVASIDTGNTANVLNVVPNVNGYGPFHDLTAFTDALPARCLGFFCCLDDDNAAHIFAGTSTKLYKLNATTRAWDDVTRASGGNYSLAEREYWSFTIFGQNVVAVADGNAPQVYTLGSSTDFAALGGSPPQARGVAVIGDFLVLYGLTSNPNRIQWSGLNNITQWTAGQESSDYQDFPDGGFVRGVGGGEFGVVFQDTALRRMIFNPGSDAIFDFSRIAEDHGLFMPYSLVKTRGSMFFLGLDGFYRMDGTGQLAAIGANRVDRTLFESLDTTSPRFMVGAADPSRHRVIWAYKSIETLNTNVLDTLLIYDWSLDRWSQAEINVEFLGQATALSTTLESLDSLGDLDSLPFSLDDYINSPAFQLAAVAASNKKLGFFDGDTLEATIETPEGTLGGAQRLSVQGVAPICDAPTAYIRVSMRETLNATPTYSTETAINFRGYAPQRQSGRFNSGLLRIPAGTEWTYARGVDVKAVKMGLR